MKQNLFLTSILALAIGFTSCGDDDEESCSNDEICEETSITVCCESQSQCTYTVNGTEYDNEEDAIENASCPASASPNDDKSEVREAIRSLTARAKANI